MELLMDPRLKKALEFSDFRQTLNQQRQQLKDKLDSDLTYGYNGGLFKIESALISFLDLLVVKDRKKNIPILDSNNNPVMVEDVEKLRDDLLDRYLTSVYSAHKEYEQIKKSRTVKKLLDI
jgi:hypothetical protein